ncbi:PTS glucose transporter subunit IIA [Bacillus sp. APMAM]|uniref:PTS sugar transporter subunit IIA n=1 Tax=Margalitia sp. FSL K6-0131 TaxID=2954604 RepID=UPI000F89AB57|nr:PTS glucose transporter subunit IIA [Bacillus sp. APMAM]RTZ53929.1 PTS glucose transporter subunit IIA [Bacillus sp. SAJ1]
MFKNLFKKTPLEIYAPVNGRVIPIEEVPDPVFSQKMMGEGIAIMPSNGGIHSPVEGTIIQVAPTKHAVGILAKDGTEILIHIGLETVALEGEGFTVRVNEGDRVSLGQLLIEVDWEYIGTHASSTVTPMVITNSHDGNKQYTFTEEKEGIQGQTVMITASGK